MTISSIIVITAGFKIYNYLPIASFHTRCVREFIHSIELLVNDQFMYLFGEFSSFFPPLRPLRYFREYNDEVELKNGNRSTKISPQTI